MPHALKQVIPVFCKSKTNDCMGLVPTLWKILGQAACLVMILGVFLSHVAEPFPPENMKEKLLRTKYGGWEYEKEIRRFVDLSKTKQEHGLHFQLFDEDIGLKEVILGVRNNHSLKAIRTLTAATNPEAVVFKVRLERRSFPIVGDGRYQPTIPIKLV